MNINGDIQSSMVAVLQTVCDKYKPGTQVLRLQSLGGINDDSTAITKVTLNKSNLMNKDTSNIPIGDINMSSSLKLEIPVEVARRFPTKYIPEGTRFIVSFTSGDITKPIVTGAEFLENVLENPTKEKEPTGENVVNLGGVKVND